VRLAAELGCKQGHSTFIAELKQRRKRVGFRNATNKIPGRYEIAYCDRGMLHECPQAAA
jgi:hypothetical protein